MIKIVSTLDGRLVDSSTGDSERSSMLAMMGAVMYGSLNSLNPIAGASSGKEDEVVRAVLPRGRILVKKDGDRLLIEAITKK